MAKIQFGAAVADARGKFAGQVFSKSRMGSYLRRKSSPVQPRTSAVTGVRSSFSGLAKRWGSVLTADQRAAWKSLAAAHPTTNVFGNSIILTGLMLYIQVNRNLASVGVATIDDAPLNLDVDAPGSISFTGGTAADFAITPAVDAAAGDHVIILAGQPQSAGRAFVGSAMRIVGTDTGGGSPYALTRATYRSFFGTLLPGQNITLGLVYVRDDTGAKSARSLLTKVIT